MKTPHVNRFQVYDTETTGIDTQCDQILQFASVETDQDLNIIESGVSNIICKQRLDVVPHPKAYLTHFLDVDVLQAEGMSEFMLAKKVQNIFMGNNATAITGYNTDKFDNELIRNLMFRNMKDLYMHEYKNENLTFDIFKLVQLVYALRPELLNWRLKDNGATSLKLEHLSADNGIAHDNAHDALDDVYATIGIAKAIKDANPKLFNYALQLSSKGNAISLLAKREPLIHINTVHGQDYNISTLIQPVIIDSSNKSKFLCLDLRHDPRPLLEMSSEDINKYLYTKREDLPEGSPIIPIVGVSANKQPLIANTQGLLTPAFADKAKLDMDQINKNLEFIKTNRGIGEKIQKAMTTNMPAPTDSYRSIYAGGFLHRDDQNQRAKLHMTKPGTEQLEIESVDVHEYSLTMRDSIRHFDLLLRGKWNSFHSHLLTQKFSPTEFRKWVDYLENKLYVGIDSKTLTIPQFFEQSNLVELEMPLSAREKEVLDKVIDHMKEVEKTVANLRELADELHPDAVEERAGSKKIQDIEKRISDALGYKEEDMAEESSFSM